LCAQPPRAKTFIVEVQAPRRNVTTADGVIVDVSQTQNDAEMMSVAKAALSTKTSNPYNEPKATLNRRVPPKTVPAIQRRATTAEERTSIFPSMRSFSLMVRVQARILQSRATMVASSTKPTSCKRTVCGLLSTGSKHT